MKPRGVRQELSAIFGEMAAMLETGRPVGSGPIVLTTGGSELGVEEMIRGARLAAADGVEVILIGPESRSEMPSLFARDERDAHEKMEQLLKTGEAEAAVTMHYSFPIGVATVGRVITPGRGRSMFIATTTGTSSTSRVEAMVRNAIYGIATAKACGIKRPTVGILNLDGARQAERILRQMAERGYDINFGTSIRADGGCVMRGNDLLAGAVDVMVTDSLTGNVLMKVFSAYTSGGDYEASGFGYGPGVGPGFDKIVCILSRVSGASVVANAIKYASLVAAGNLVETAQKEIDFTIRTGVAGFLHTNKECPQVEDLKARSRERVRGGEAQSASGEGPKPKVVTEEIAGIDILELEEAAVLLRKKGIYASTGMGCTGPVILVAPEDKNDALNALKEGRYLQ